MGEKALICIVELACSLVTAIPAWFKPVLSCFYDHSPLCYCSFYLKDICNLKTT